MAQNKSVGASGILVIIGIRNDDGTIKNFLGSTPLVPDLQIHSGGSKGGILTTTLSVADDGSTISIAFNHSRDDATTLAFLKKYAGLSSDSGNAVYGTDQFENNEQDDGSTGADVTKQVFFMWAGKQPNSYNGNAEECKVTYGVANVAPSSNNYSTAYQTTNKFTYTLNIVKEDSDVVAAMNGMTAAVIGHLTGEAANVGAAGTLDSAHTFTFTSAGYYQEIGNLTQTT
jgi:hypothetical protein